MLCKCAEDAHVTYCVLDRDESEQKPPGSHRHCRRHSVALIANPTGEFIVRRLLTYTKLPAGENASKFLS